MTFGTMNNLWISERPGDEACPRLSAPRRGGRRAQRALKAVQAPCQ
jgi:hypothetical protein